MNEPTKTERIPNMKVVSSGEIADLMYRQCQEANQDLMIGQLGNLVERGIIKWVPGEMSIVRHPIDPYKFEIRVSGKFECSEQEYIEKLEKENDDMRNQLDLFKDAVKGIRQ
jgi:hypothetical protein